MNLHSACRALMCGATLLAATATAAPSCLVQQQPDKDQQQQRPWRTNPCHLVDAQKPENEQKNDGEDKARDVHQLLDEIDKLSRLSAPAGHEPELLWLAGHDDDGQRQAQGAPGDALQHVHPVNQAGVLRDARLTGVSQVDGAIPAVPEPAQVGMLLAGLAVLAGFAARGRRRT